MCAERAQFVTLTLVTPAQASYASGEVQRPESVLKQAPPVGDPRRSAWLRRNLGKIV